MAGAEVAMTGDGRRGAARQGCRALQWDGGTGDGGRGAARPTMACA